MVVRGYVNVLDEYAIWVGGVVLVGQLVYVIFGELDVSVKSVLGWRDKKNWYRKVLYNRKRLFYCRMLFESDQM